MKKLEGQVNDILGIAVPTAIQNMLVHSNRIKR